MNLHNKEKKKKELSARIDSKDSSKKPKKNVCTENARITKNRNQSSTRTRQQTKF